MGPRHRETFAVLTTVPMVTSHRVMVPGFGSDGPSLAAVRLLIEWLAEGIDRSLRLRIEGRSSGPRPRWAVASSAVKVRRLEHGSIDLDMTAPQLEDMLKTHVSWLQQDLFLSKPNPHQNPIGLFAESVRDAVSGQDDADTLDVPFLTHIASVKSLFDAGASSVILGYGDKNYEPVLIDRSHLAKILEMSKRTPRTQRVRIWGKLDTVSISTGAFILLVNGVPLRGLAEQMKPDQARDLLGHNVVVEGDLVYRPSARPFRLDTVWMRLAKDADRELNFTLPNPKRVRKSLPSARGGWGEIFEGLKPVDDDESEAPET